MGKFLSEITVLLISGLLVFIGSILMGLTGVTMMVPGGMLGGIATFVALGLILVEVAVHGFSSAARPGGKLRKLHRKPKSKEIIKADVREDPIATKVKGRLFKVVDGL